MMLAHGDGIDAILRLAVPGTMLATGFLLAMATTRREDRDRRMKAAADHARLTRARRLRGSLRPVDGDPAGSREAGSVLPPSSSR